MKLGHRFSSRTWSISDLEEILMQEEPISLIKESKDAVQKCRSYLESKLKDGTHKIYGINTGFGALCDVQISNDQIRELQNNLVVSHACGTGDLVPTEIVKIILLLKIKNLSFGHSGVRLKLVEMLIDLYNNDLLPKIYQLGSLGASGDLAPLAHLSLVLLGKGEVFYNGAYVPAKEALQKSNIQPIQLEAKEGIALLNGTQFSTAYASYMSMHAERIFRLANMITALSLEGFNGQIAPLTKSIHSIRPHQGQILAAKDIRSWLKGSKLEKLELESVQDPYSFRCAPQVHGASYDCFEYLRKTVETEINGVTDNPLIFPDEDLIVSGGNFHAQPIAYALDFASIALSEIGSISERRIFRLVNGDRGLPPFLVHNPGLHSGLMIAQYTAASIVSQNKQLCTPASIDSISSSRGQEDHVSMAANAGTKAYSIIQNVYRVLGIELLCASQAFGFRGNRTLNSNLSKVLEQFRSIVPLITEDRILSEDIHKSEQFLRTLDI